VARLGGDEFTIIVGSVHAETDVTDVAGKLHAVFAEPFILDKIVVQIGASIGWAMYPDDGASTAQIMAVADKRMYLEKRVHRASANTNGQDSLLANVMGLS